MNKTVVKTIWFDLGNVILPFDFTQAFKRISRYSDFSPEAFRRYFARNPHLEEQSDTGELTARELYGILKKRFALRNIDYDRFKTIWNDIFKENRGTSSIIRRLKKRGLRLILVSNTNRLHMEHIKKTYPVLNQFDRLILSYELGDRKPNPGMYKKALNVSKALPAEIFYTDDRRALTKAASSNHGVRAHVFRDYKELEAALVKCGAL